MNEEGLAPAVDEEAAASGLPGLLEKVVEFYHAALLRGSRGLRRLKRLALDDAHLVETFRLGHCEGKLLPLIPEDDPRRAELRRLGLLDESLGVPREALFDHLVVPLADADDGLLALWGLHGKSGKDALVPPDACPLWNLRAAKLYPEVLLCADPIDALSLTRAGFPNALGLAEGPLQAEHVALLRSLGVQKVALLAAKDDLQRLRPRFAALAFAGIALPGPRALNALLAGEGERALVDWVEARLKAAPVEQPPVAGVAGSVATVADGLSAAFGNRSYVLRGIEKTPRRLRATVRTEFRGKLHVDTLDFYNARCRKTLAQDLCRLFEESADVIEIDIGRLVKLCEAHEPGQATPVATPLVLCSEERAEAEAFGKSPDLLEKIAADFEACGLIGERGNKLVSYLAAVSRKLPDPLSILVLSSSGAGKSALQDATLAFCPPEDVVKLTSLTGKALFYKDRASLKHKVLALEEGAGAEQATYAIRTLVSAKELVIEAAVKDFGTGKLTTMQNRVEGPTSVFITTTDPDVDPETRSRFLVLTVDESREQTRAILAEQRRRQTLAAVTGRESVESVLRRHRNFQRLLRPLLVVNPHVGEVDYRDDRLQSRRDHPKYLNLIRALAFVRQMQKEVKYLRETAVEPALRSLGEVGYVEATAQDVADAAALMQEIQGRNPDDLNGVSRALLAQIGQMVRERVEAQLAVDPDRAVSPEGIQFTRREIREHTGWSHNRVKRYLKQLVEMEFVLAESGRFGSTYRYRLAGDACNEADQPGHHLAGTWPRQETGGTR
jgi:hypothetical protein